MQELHPDFAVFPTYPIILSTTPTLRPNLA